MIELTTHPIDTSKIIDAATARQAGAVSVFIGTVRNQTAGKEVVKLEYEAYEPMAINEIQKVIDMAKKKMESYRVGFQPPNRHPNAR